MVVNYSAGFEGVGGVLVFQNIIKSIHKVLDSHTATASKNSYSDKINKLRFQ